MRTTVTAASASAATTTATSAGEGGAAAAPPPPGAAAPTRCPLASPGDSLADVDTPALLLDLDAFERNVETMRAWVERHNAGRRRDREKGEEEQEQEPPELLLRPHAKTHKAAEVALWQIKKGGAVGVCVQKLDEAAAMLDGGVRDILVTNEIVGKKKVARLVSLLRHPSKPKIGVIVDDARNVHDIASELERSGLEEADADGQLPSLGVLLEVNGGQDRCGVDSRDTESIGEIYHAIESHAPRLTFRGVHCYGGGLQHVRSAEERKGLVESETVDAARRVRDVLAGMGASCEVVTGGGTGTFPFEAEGGVHNEIQPGSYVFMDVDYGMNEDGKDMFENALYVHTSVVSTAAAPGKRTIVDAGSKAVSLDCGPPLVTKSETNGGLSGSVDDGVIYECGGDEHGILIHSAGDGKLNVGETVRMIPGHIDPTVNMHDWLVCVRKQAADGLYIVEETWKIGGRGPGI